MYFRDLIISGAGKEVWGRLVQSLINRYLSDEASTDAISNRLRDVCPNLYNHEDGIALKAHEILITARTKTNPDERSKMLHDALNKAKGISAY